MLCKFVVRCSAFGLNQLQQALLLFRNIFLFHLIHFSRSRRLFTSPRDGRRVELIVGGGDDVGDDGGDRGCSTFPTSPLPLVALVKV